MITHNIPFFNMSNKKHPKLSQICSYGIFLKGLKNEFETAMVNEPSVLEPLKIYCTCITCRSGTVVRKLVCTVDFRYLRYRYLMELSYIRVWFGRISRCFFTFQLLLNQNTGISK